MSMLGFGLFAIILSMLGPILSVAYEAWIGYVAPVVGGVVGAAIGSGYITGGIRMVGLSALVGGLALVMFQVSTSERRVGIKDMGECLAAGIGFGIINGVILAVLFQVLEVLR